MTFDICEDAYFTLWIMLKYAIVMSVGYTEYVAGSMYTFKACSVFQHCPRQISCEGLWQKVSVDWANRVLSQRRFAAASSGDFGVILSIQHVWFLISLLVLRIRGYPRGFILSNVPFHILPEDHNKLQIVMPFHWDSRALAVVKRLSTNISPLSARTTLRSLGFLSTTFLSISDEHPHRSDRSAESRDSNANHRILFLL